MENSALSEKRGNAFGIAFFRWFLRWFGINRACEFVWFICLYYLLVDRQAVKSIMPYVEHRFPGAGRLKRQWYAYRMFVSNGQSMLICAANVAGYSFTKEFSQREAVLAYLQNSTSGMVIITSHFGNWQMAMKNMMDDLERPINFLMRPEHNKHVREALKHNPDAEKLHVIPIDDEFGGMFGVIEALQRNEVVCIMGDRAVTDRHVDVSFLDATAQFPFTAFFMAAQMKCPVVPVFVARSPQKHNHLLISFGELIMPENSAADKKNRFKRFVQQYVDALAAKAQQYPFQCYMFHDPWHKNDADNN
jgi:predicted LPLAT superfamily acyltransferase